MIKEEKEKKKAGQSLQIIGFYHKLGDVRPEDRKIIEKCCVLLCSDEKFPISVTNSNPLNKSQEVPSRADTTNTNRGSESQDMISSSGYNIKSILKESNSSFSLLDAGVDATMVDLTDCDKT